MAELWRWSNTQDFHPPGAHAVDRLALLVVRSDRLLAALHLLIWSAGVLWFVLSARRFTASRWGQALFTAVSFMHPQALMWGSSIRWYPVWWGLAMAVIVAGVFQQLPPRAPP